MSKRLTNEEFIDRCIKIHGDIFGFEKLNYINNHTKIILKCSKHGYKDVQKIITEKARLVNLKSVNKYSKENILLESYNSIREAATSNNLPESNISMCCNGKLKTCGGFKWKFN